MLSIRTIGVVWNHRYLDLPDNLAQNHLNAAIVTILHDSSVRMQVVSIATHLLKGAKHGTRRIFNKFDCEGYQGFEGLLREAWFQGLRRRYFPELAGHEERSARGRS